ncbi:MAG: tripartite tricarboxylate transporter substrate binding protein [Hyphomicrobiaceae bacterium]
MTRTDHKLDRRAVVAGLGGGAAIALAGSAAAQSAAFPTRAITLICPWPAGGPTDVVMRAMAEFATKHLGQSVVVDNKGGASGTLGPATMAATAKPDGYTISQMPITTVRLPMTQKTAFDTIKDFTYIIHLTGYVFGVTAKGDSPYKTWADVVSFAKANPGKLNYASTGSGTSLHIGMEQIAAHSGLKFNHVPFKGEAEAFTALIGGHVDLMAAGTGRDDMIKSGGIRVLNIWAEKRSQRIPDVPTLKELGYPFVFDSPWGFAGPKGMDPAVVTILQDVFKRALEDKEVLATMEKFEMQPNYMDAAAYTKFVPELIAQERTYLDRLGMLKKD